MDYTVREFEAGEYELLSKILEQMERYRKAAGIDHLPPYFDIGDRVGFFYGPGANDHAIGLITACGEQFTTVKTENGRSHQVSPFVIFRLP